MQDNDTGEDRHRFARVPIRYLLPNLVTLLALCSGITAIRLGIEGRYELAVSAVIVAIVLDAVDGRLARLLKGASRFGAELDSLADFVNFGVAPALLMYQWSLHALRNLGWIAALALAVCCALRLARFNVAIDDPGKPPFAANYFTGAPAPAGAMLAMAPMYLGFLGLIPDGAAAAPFILPYFLAVALLMVSRIPTYSGKAAGSRIRREMMAPVLGLLALVIVLLISYTWEMLALLVAVYVAFIPVNALRYRRQQRDWEATRPPVSEG